MIILFKASNVW